MAKKTISKKTPTKKVTTKKTVTKKKVKVRRTRRRPYEFPAEQHAAEAGAFALSNEKSASTNDQPAVEVRSDDTTRATVTSDQQSNDAPVEHISDSALGQEPGGDSVVPLADGKQAAGEPLQPAPESKPSAAASTLKAKRQPTDDVKLTPPNSVDDIIKTHVIMAMGIGTIPAPVFDAVAITVLQTRMVRQIADAYAVPFERTQAWTVTSITGVLTFPGGLISSMAKSIPVIGPWLGGTSVTLVAGASTYVIGRVFAQHFDSGGTFLTLDPVEAKRAYSEGLDKGKDKAANIAAEAAGRFRFGFRATD